MEILTTIGIIIIWGVAVLLSRMVTTTIHELGHAVPALLFTKSDVTIHVGSYGNEHNNTQLRLGRLKAHLKFNILHLNLGMCTHKGPATYRQQLLIILGGPVFSLLLAALLLSVILIWRFSDWTIALVFIFILSAFWDFLVNMYPFSQPIALYDGGQTYNDGRQLLNTWREMQYPPSYFKGIDYLGKKDYQGAITQFRKTIDQGFTDRQVYYKLIQALKESGKYRPAVDCYEELTQFHKLKPEDYKELANLYFKYGQYPEALRCLDHCIHYDFRNTAAYNDRGYVYYLAGAYQKAISDFKLGIFHDMNYAPSYYNLALAQVKTNDREAAFTNLEKANKINPADPFLHLHYGYVYQEIGDHSKALEHFKKAKNLNIQFDRIDELIEQVAN